MNKILAVLTTLTAVTLGVAQADSQTAICKQLMKSLDDHIEEAMKYSEQNKYALVVAPAAAGAKEVDKYLKKCNPSPAQQIILIEVRFNLRGLSRYSYMTVWEKHNAK